MPVAAVAVTVARIAMGTEVSIVTWFRVNKILAGETLALNVRGDPAGRWRRALGRGPN